MIQEIKSQADADRIVAEMVKKYVITKAKTLSTPSDDSQLTSVTVGPTEVHSFPVYREHRDTEPPDLVPF